MAHAHLPWDESNSVIFPQRSRKADHEYYLALDDSILVVSPQRSRKADHEKG